MKITDDKIRAALRTKAAPSEDTSILLLEQLEMNKEERKSSHMNVESTVSVRNTMYRNLQALLIGLAAMAVLAVIAVVVFKQVQSVQAPFAESVPKAEMETEIEPASWISGEGEDENSIGIGNEPDPTAADDEKEPVEENTFLRVPIQPEALHWGMGLEEVMEILGDPVERSSNGSGIQLVYDQPMETPLGLCTYLRLRFDFMGPRLSSNRSIPLGLNYIIADYAGTEEEFNKRLDAFYGEYDAVQELEHPLEQIGETSGLRYILYEWDGWELKELPDLMERYAQVQKEATDYLSLSGTVQILPMDDMALEIRLTCQEKSPEDTRKRAENTVGTESKPEPSEGPEDTEQGDLSKTVPDAGISVTFDATRYLVAAMPEKMWSYELEGISFTMPALWQKLGASFVRTENGGAVVYRGLNLLRFYKVPTEMTEYGGDPINYSAGIWDLGNGYSLTMEVHNWAMNINSDGQVTTVDGYSVMCLEDLDPVTYDRDEDLEDILYALTGESYDMDQIRDRNDPAGSEAIMAAFNFISQNVLPNVKVVSVLPSCYLTDYLDAEPFNYSSLDDPDSVFNCQILDQQLNGMSDEELILTVLDYPLFDSLYDSFGTNEAWGDAMKLRFNGFRELSERGEQAPGILATLNRCHDYVVREFGWNRREILTPLEKLILYLDETIDENSTIW